MRLEDKKITLKLDDNKLIKVFENYNKHKISNTTNSAPLSDKLK